MLSPASPIPSICISPAPPAEIPDEPYSPFSSISSPSFDSDELDSPRSTHLMPPPVMSPMRPEGLPAMLRRSAPKGQGLDKARFDSLLKSTRERNAVPVKKAVDLRKEVTLKAHKSKAAERRALFLSKIEAPPSPSATDTPVTPPESPALFHFSLPSPGLDSPIALYESLSTVADKLGDETSRRSMWIEQVDFQSGNHAYFELEQEEEKKMARKQAILLKRTSALPVPPSRSSSRALPSLDQISARMNSQTLAHNAARNRTAVRRPEPAAVPVAAPTPRAPIPLPAFLRNRPTEKVTTPTITMTPPPPELPTSPAAPARVLLPALSSCTPPSPLPAPHPKLNISTTVFPTQDGVVSSPEGAASSSGVAVTDATSTPLTAANLSLLESRSQKGKAMLEKILRRVSSPAELQKSGKRIGEVFGEHAVLKVPGGF